MILTPIPQERLGEALDRFAARLDDPDSRAAFTRIRATSPDRAEGAEAERNHREALALARRLGVPVHPPGTPRRSCGIGVRIILENRFATETQRSQREIRLQFSAPS